MVIIVDFEDEQVPCSRWDLSKRIWGSVSPSYQSSSGPWENVYRIFQVNSVNRVQYVRNATSLGSNPSTPPTQEVRDVVGPYRLKRKIRTESTCAHEAWAEEALELARADGVPISLYTQYSFVLPSSRIMHTSLCRWSGLAHVTCYGRCRSWVSECSSLGVFAHELGHNAGLSHSGSWWSFSNAGQIEYGDPTAIMGNLWSARNFAKNDFYFTASMRAVLGWLPSSQYLTLASSIPPSPPTANVTEIPPSEAIKDSFTALADDIREPSKRDFSAIEATYPAPNRYGVIFNETHYRFSSPNVPGQTTSCSRIFHRDGSYFRSETARIFRLAPHHVENVESSGVLGESTFKAIKIMKMSGASAYWFSFQVGRATFAQSALVHLASPSGTQSYIIKTLVPHIDMAKNISLAVQSTVFYDQDNVFAARVIRTSETNLDLQVTWRCEHRVPMIDVVQTPPSPSSIPSSTSSPPYIDFIPGLDIDTAKVLVQSTSQRVPFSLSVSNLDSDMCRPVMYEFEFEVPSQVNFTCATSTMSLAPGGNYLLDCEITFLHGMPNAPINITTKQITTEALVEISSRTTSVTLVSSGCQKAAPLLTLSSRRASAIGSAPAIISATIKNMDSPSCSARSFTVTTVVGEGWRAELDRSIPSISPGKTATIGIRVSPTTSNVYNASHSNSTFVSIYVYGRDDKVNSSMLPQAQALVQHLGPCVRANPTLEMENFAVRFYVRNAAKAPVRVTNRDSPSCPPLSTSIALVPDPHGVFQSALYPSSINLKPGEYYEYPLAVTTPDMDTSDAEFFTGLKLSYDRAVSSSSRDFAQSDAIEAVQDYKITASAVDVPCQRNTPAMHFACPRYIPLMSSMKTVIMKCDTGFRNDDTFQCLSSHYNFSVHPVAINVTALPQKYQDGTDLLDLDSIELDPSELHLVPAATVFGSARISLNLTGLYHLYWNTSSPSQNARLQLQLNMVDVDAADHSHSGYYRTDFINVGVCAINDPAAVTLSPGSGPYSWITIEKNTTDPEPEEPPPEIAATNFVDSPAEEISAPIDEFEPLSPPSEPLSPPYDNSTHEHQYPVISVPFGASKLVNWTVYNPASPFCARLMYAPLMHPDSDALLKKLGVRYELKTAQILAQKADNVSMELKLPASLPSTLPPDFNGLVNITTRVRWVLNATLPHNFSPWTTLFLNLSGDCVVRKTFVTKVNPLFLETGNLTDAAIPTEIPIFNISQFIHFWTIINVTNNDTESCGSNFWNVSNLYSFSARRSWPVIRYPFEVDAQPIELDGSPSPTMSDQPFAISAGQSQLFNVSVIAPSSLGPGSYPVDIVITTNGRPEHDVSHTLRFLIPSVAPAPPSYVAAVEVKNVMGISIGHDIIWTACERPGDCICPCTYHIRVNGKLAGSVDWLSNKYFAHRYSISQADVYTSVEVVVEDYRGRTSPAFAAEGFVSYTPSDSPYSHLFILLVLLAVTIFPMLVICMECLRHQDKLPLSNLRFDESDSDEELA